MGTNTSGALNTRSKSASIFTKLNHKQSPPIMILLQIISSFTWGALPESKGTKRIGMLFNKTLLSISHKRLPKLVLMFAFLSCFHGLQTDRLFKQLPVHCISFSSGIWNYICYIFVNYVKVEARARFSRELRTQQLPSKLLNRVQIFQFFSVGAELLKICPSCGCWDLLETWPCTPALPTHKGQCACKMLWGRRQCGRTVHCCCYGLKLPFPAAWPLDSGQCAPPCKQEKRVNGWPLLFKLSRTIFSSETISVAPGL